MRILAAMSGGVDSSVAAALLVEQGHEVLGVTLRLLPKLESGFGCCGSPRDVEDAQDVCRALGIPHYVLDMAKLFDRTVIAPFVSAYRNGCTPNPCVECNRHVKFGHLHRLAEAWGLDAVATGHYARVEDGRLLKAADEAKDQTYFLYSLTRRELGRVLFPLGGLTKPQVRAKARALGLSTADKAESQEICFVPGGDYRALVASRGGAAGERPGEVKDASGRVLGRHDGLSAYTVGQRKGLGRLKRPAGPSAEPLYVVALEPATATLVVGPEEQALTSRFTAGRVSWTSEEPPRAHAPAAGEVRAPRADAPREVAPSEARAWVRVRHRHRPAAARLTPLEGGRVEVEFDEPQRAVAPGQAAVFYRGDEVLGGGTIEARLPRADAPREVAPSEARAPRADAEAARGTAQSEARG